MEKIQKPRGFDDWHDLCVPNSSVDQTTGLIFRDTSCNYSRKKYVCDLIEKVFMSWGYLGIDTPIVEEVSVFKDNDEAFLEANKELFFLETKEERQCVLRPENTASIARAISEGKFLEKNPMVIPVYYRGPFFRYERPQKGRFRQFTQMGIERINAGSARDDVENILVMANLMKIFDIPERELKLKINFFSNKEVLKKWNKSLRKYFSEHKDQLSENSKKRVNKNPYRILDDEEDSKKDFVKNAPLIESCFTEEDIKKKEELEKVLKEHDIHPDWTSNLVRGIDYYTGLVYEWEWQNNKEKKLSVAAGGRYDDLFLRFGDKSYPSSGLAIGIERFMLVLDNVDFWKKIVTDQKNDQLFYFSNNSSTSWKDLKKLLESDWTQEEKFCPRVFTEYGNFKYTEHLSRAERMGATWVLYIEDNETKKTKKIRVFNIPQKDGGDFLLQSPNEFWKEVFGFIEKKFINPK